MMANKWEKKGKKTDILVSTATVVLSSIPHWNVPYWNDSAHNAYVLVLVTFRSGKTFQADSAFFVVTNMNKIKFHSFTYAFYNSVLTLDTLLTKGSNSP